MRKLLLAALLASVALVGLGSTAPVPAAEEEPEPTDAEQDCDELIPHSASPLYTERPDDGKVVDLSVAILNDGVPADRVARAVAAAAAAYEPLAIRLRAVSITPVQLPADGQGPTGKPAMSPMDAIDAAKAHFSGSRPAGADIVYVITAKDLVDPDLGDQVAGFADCIGGVRYADRAFAVGELRDSAYGVGPVVFQARSTVKILAHEIGHLLGAHHHYANCGEAIGPEDVSGDTGPCTLMVNFVDVQGLTFSSLEAAVVRGHATDFARP